MKVSVVGATAYSSRELLKLLARHPEADVIHLGGRREGNPRISDIFTDLRGICDMALGGLDVGDALEKPDLAFFTLPHGVSQQYVPKYLAAGVRCVDFSADYRLPDLALFEAWYGKHADPVNLERAVYGLPELFRDEIAEADLVANPGCYPTAVSLALAPLIKEDGADLGRIFVDAKSGVSGRGNKVDEGSMFLECNEDVRAYGVAGHRHEPEMGYVLEALGAPGVDLTFVPHLVPMDRGILSTIFVPWKGAADAERLQRLYEDFYSAEPFVRVCPAGEQPRTKNVAFTNYCDIAVTVRKGDRLVLTAAIDNLMKGASSQAVQNLNVMFGLEETLGLL